MRGSRREFEIIFNVSLRDKIYSLEIVLLTAEVRDNNTNWRTSVQLDDYN